MAKPPEVVGLMLCERMEVDPQHGGRISLVGLFRDRRFPSFPTGFQPFTAYCSLSGGEGEGRIKLVVSRWPEEQDIYKYERWLAFPDIDTLLDLEIPVRKCRFPRPGRYCFQLRFEEELLAQRFVDVRVEES